MAEQAHQGTNRAILFGLGAVVIAGVTAGGAWWVVNGYQKALEAARRPAETLEVVAAARDIGPGEVLNDTDLVTTRVAMDGVTSDQYFRTADELLGATVSDRVLAGEPIRRQRLDSGEGLDDATLEPGTRAVTLRVDRAAGVGGLVEPGAYVDVIVTIRPDENALDAKWVTETILQAVRVLAVGDSAVASVRPGTTAAQASAARKDDTMARYRELYATLEVEPEEAEKLAMATTRGDVYLSLRPRNDFDLLENNRPLVTNALVGIDARPSPARAERLQRRRVALVVAPPPPEPPPGSAAEVISGSTTRVEHFTPAGTRVIDTKKGK